MGASRSSRLRMSKRAFRWARQTVTILKGISFEIGAGEFVSIVGPSGNGKSTLLNMMTGIDRPTSGEVIVAGQDLNKMSENQLALWRRNYVGIIFQIFSDVAGADPAGKRYAPHGPGQQILPQRAPGASHVPAGPGWPGRSGGQAAQRRQRGAAAASRDCPRCSQRPSFYCRR